MALHEYLHGHQHLVKTLRNIDVDIARMDGSQRILSNSLDISGFLAVIADALENELPFLQTN
jgi:hypothetical protein